MKHINRICMSCLVAIVCIAAAIPLEIHPSGETTAEQSQQTNLARSGYDGSTLYVGGSGPNNYTSIQAAVDNASDGDTVFVYDDASPYQEHIRINKSVHLIGEKEESTKIVAKEGSSEIIHITAQGVSLKNFTLEGQNRSNGIMLTSADNTIHNITICYAPYGIQLNRCHGNSITHTTIYTTSANWSYGVDLQNATSNRIERNYIHTTYVAVLADHSHKNMISHNLLPNNALGVWLINSHQNNIISNDLSSSINILSLNSEGNLVSKNIINGAGRKEIGIGLDTCNGTEVFHNYISGVRYGIGLFDGTSNIKIEGNEIISNSRGIYLTNARGNNISKNMVYNNRVGIFLRWLNAYNRISKNKLADNDVGIRLNYSWHNIVGYNDFMNNSKQAIFHFAEFSLRQAFSNRWISNYWSNWHTIIPKPIIGYGRWTHMPLLNFDWYPAQQPYEWRST